MLNELIADYMAERAMLTTRTIQLSQCPTWIGYEIAMRDLKAQIAVIDANVLTLTNNLTK